MSGSTTPSHGIVGQAPRNGSEGPCGGVAGQAVSPNALTLTAFMASLRVKLHLFAKSCSPKIGFLAQEYRLGHLLAWQGSVMPAWLVFVGQFVIIFKDFISRLAPHLINRGLGVGVKPTVDGVRWMISPS